MRKSDFPQLWFGWTHLYYGLVSIALWTSSLTVTRRYYPNDLLIYTKWFHLYSISKTAFFLNSFSISSLLFSFFHFLFLSDFGIPVIFRLDENPSFLQIAYVFRYLHTLHPHCLASTTTLFKNHFPLLLYLIAHGRYRFSVGHWTPHSLFL